MKVNYIMIKNNSSVNTKFMFENKSYMKINITHFFDCLNLYLLIKFYPC